MKKHTGTLKLLNRMKSSINGNPRYSGIIQDENGDLIEFCTKPDCSIGYKITNYLDKQVRIEIGPYRGKDSLVDIDIL